MLNPRFLKLMERWRNPEPPEPREEIHTSESGLTQLLQRNSDGKPIVKLTPLEKTAVNTPTQEVYNELMRTYELGGWKWRGGGDLPTQYDGWNDYKKDTCVDAGYYDEKSNKEGFKFAKRKWYQSENWKIISPQDFYDIQNITPEMLQEINIWFDENGK